VAGVDVYAVTVETRDGRTTVRSASDGSFAVTVPKRGPFRIAGSEPRPPRRQFSSELLHGAAADVVIKDWSANADGVRPCDVVVVDAATRAAIPRFHLSQQISSDLQGAMFFHSLRREAYEGMAHLRLEPHPGQPMGIVVDAPGHAFEVVALPDNLQQPLVVELGAEAAFAGRVTDAETGAPIAGVAVRALPKGTGSGTGGRAEDSGPLTDAQGRYRVGGLRPGEYGVQVHAAGRPASAVTLVTVQIGSESTLDLVAPKRRWLEGELVGTLPAGVHCSLSSGYAMPTSDKRGVYEHLIFASAPTRIDEAGAFKLGPLGNGNVALQLWVPSRVRIGTGTAVQLGDFNPDRGPTAVKLPELTTEFIRGHVELPGNVPTERIAVLATAVSKQRQPWLLRSERPNVAGIDGDGNFVLDLPAGTYHLQLVDVLTGIIVHTEGKDLAVGENPAALAIRPEIHWLAIDLVPGRVGEDVVLECFGITLPRPRDDDCAAFLFFGNLRDNQEQCFVPFHLGATKQRWLVPSARIEVEARQGFAVLLPWGHGSPSTTVASATVNVAEAEHAIRMTIPAPPSDEELLKKD
jgi:protocatechuate 3,4-dioxygenase beta subunit